MAIQRKTKKEQEEDVEQEKQGLSQSNFENVKQEEE